MEDNTFIQKVVKWINLDNQINELTRQVRDLKIEKKREEEGIIEHMIREEQEVLKISSGGSLRKSTSRSKGQLTPQHVLEVISSLTRNESEAGVVTEAIFNKRPVVERTYLKRCRPKRQ